MKSKHRIVAATITPDFDRRAGSKYTDLDNIVEGMYYDSPQLVGSGRIPNMSDDRWVKLFTTIIPDVFNNRSASDMLDRAHMLFKFSDQGGVIVRVTAEQANKLIDVGICDNDYFDICDHSDDDQQDPEQLLKQEDPKQLLKQAICAAVEQEDFEFATRLIEAVDQTCTSKSSGGFVG